jgi:hypothetical protein
MSLKIVALTNKCSIVLRKSGPLFLKNAETIRELSSDRSIVDRFSAGIQSPFDNPRRIRQVMILFIDYLNKVFTLGRKFSNGGSARRTTFYSTSKQNR